MHVHASFGDALKSADLVPLPDEVIEHMSLENGFPFVIFHQSFFFQ